MRALVSFTLWSASVGALGAVVCQFDACCHAAPLTISFEGHSEPCYPTPVCPHNVFFGGSTAPLSQHDRDQLDSHAGWGAQMNEEEFAKFLGTFVQAVWMQLVQVSLRPGQARSQALGRPCL